MSRMSDRTRRMVAAALAIIAVAAYLADLMGLKPPPRILPSLVLGGAAVLIGVAPRTGSAERSPGRPDRLMANAGIALHLLLAVPLVPIGLVAPGAGILTIHGLWVLGFIVVWSLRRSNPAVVLAIPFVTGLAVAGVLWFGTSVLGWQP